MSYSSVGASLNFFSGIADLNNLLLPCIGWHHQRRFRNVGNQSARKLHHCIPRRQSNCLSLMQTNRVKSSVPFAGISPRVSLGIRSYPPGSSGLSPSEVKVGFQHIPRKFHHSYDDRRAAVYGSDLSKKTRKVTIPSDVPAGSCPMTPY